MKVTFGSPISIDAYVSGPSQIPQDELYRRITGDVRLVIEKLLET